MAFGEVLQILGAILAIGGSVIIGYGGLPDKRDVRAHGTYGGARAIWRAMGRQYGYTLGGLVVTVCGAVLMVLGLNPAWANSIAMQWIVPVIGGIGLCVAAFVAIRGYARRIAAEWENMP